MGTMGITEDKDSGLDQSEVVASESLPLDKQKELIEAIKSRSKSESKEAFGILFSAFYPDLQRFAWWVLWQLSDKNIRSIEDDSHELAMKTFVTFMDKSLFEFEWPANWRNPQKSPIKEYLFKILRYHCKELGRDVNYLATDINDPELERSGELLIEDSDLDQEAFDQDFMDYHAMVLVFQAVGLDEMIPLAPQWVGRNLPPRLLVDQAADVKFYQLISPLSLPQKQVLTLKYYFNLTAPEIAAKLGLKAGAVRQHINRGLGKIRDSLE
jgi:RNA polymerase sigma factor (sigma-70 family)